MSGEQWGESGWYSSMIPVSPQSNKEIRNSATCLDLGNILSSISSSFRRERRNSAIIPLLLYLFIPFSVCLSAEFSVNIEMLILNFFWSFYSFNQELFPQLGMISYLKKRIFVAIHLLSPPEQQTSTERKKIFIRALESNFSRGVLRFLDLCIFVKLLSPLSLSLSNQAQSMCSATLFAWHVGEDQGGWGL
jgi:hypothetical protein